MDDRLLFLLLGLVLKQWIDEVNRLVESHVEELKRRREAVQAYIPVPALVRGTPEEQRALAQHQHRARVEPEVRALAKHIKKWRMVRFVVCTVVFLALFVYALLKTPSL